MRKAILIPFLALLALSNFASSAGHTGAFNLRILNNSNSEIRQMRLAWSGTGRWGPDVLGKRVLKPRESFDIPGLSAGDYDILFINTGGRGCVAGPIPVYDNMAWDLTERKCRPLN
jgi:hypothetical protein